jgi:hypothetical protein
MEMVQPRGIVNISGLTRKDRQPRYCGALSPQAPAEPNGGAVHRRITPEAGRGLEILGHAVEYLTDEFVCDGCRFAEDRGRLQAIQLLASLNRQIYFDCVVEPRFGERLESMFRRLFRMSYARN